MEAVGIVIVILLVAAFALGKAGSGGMALLAVLVAAGLFVMTPAGRPVPGAIADFVNGVNEATTPMLNRPAGDGGGAAAG
jgi:hypothetical protein